MHVDDGKNTSSATKYLAPRLSVMPRTAAGEYFTGKEWENIAARPIPNLLPIASLRVPWSNGIWKAEAMERSINHTHPLLLQPVLRLNLLAACGARRVACSEEGIIISRSKTGHLKHNVR